MSANVAIGPGRPLADTTVIVVEYPLQTVAMKAAQHLAHGHQFAFAAGEQIFVQRRQAVPGDTRALVVGVVVAEVERQQIEPRMMCRHDVGVGVRLFVVAIAIAQRHGRIGVGEVLVEGVVERIEEMLHVEIPADPPP